jgi:predicted AAA+ superfamily ATPase
MKRLALEDLKAWLSNKYRKPLILRGARQVGKSTLVRLFCEQEGLDLIELNFEIESLRSIESDDFKIQSLLDEIQLKKQKEIAKNTIVFFDEIQESPKLLKYLRYFYEKHPEIKIIAAGSLLEIALRSEDFSFPVGRVEFYHLGPMSFKEFLWATGQSFLDQKLSNFEFSNEVHKAAIKALKDYYYVGGMPEAVKVFSETKSLVQMRRIQEQIVQTYQADFPKYNKRVNVQRISRVFNSLASRVGEKIIYSKLDRESTSRDIKRIVELLIDSRVVLSCNHTNGNNIPLEGEVDSKIFKTYLLDIGILNSLLRLDIDSIDDEFKQKFSNKGMIAEQFVAQHLNFFSGPFLGPKLYYHLKDKGTQKAEIDFLIEDAKGIYPLEVKASAKGHLKSLMYFSSEKFSKVAIKVSIDEFNIDSEFVGNTKLISVPLYAIEYLKYNMDKII